MNTPSNILVGCSDRVVWVRVDGKGSWVNSAGLKEFARAMIARGYREFVFDLRRCPVMDSTFMGTLAGIALQLRELGEGVLKTAHLNARCRELLRNLGLDRLFVIDDNAAPSPNGEALESHPDRTEQAQTMLEAHESLVEAAPENLTKFKDVLEYLKQDLAE